MKIRDAGFAVRREGDVAVVTIRIPYTGQPGCDLHGNEARARFIRWVLGNASGMLFDQGSPNDQAFAEAAEAYAAACVEDEDAEMGGEVFDA